MTREDRLDYLRRESRRRILILDGAMGTMIQRRKLSEADYRGARFQDWPRDLKGNNDLLVLTKPEIIEEIHRDFLDAGADILETNSFSATSIAQADYGMEELAPEIAYAAAAVARRAADAKTAETPDRPRLVAGAFGPTNRTASVSPDVNDPGYRNTDFEALRAAYRDQAEAMIEGGADLLLVETCFDTLNAKAAFFAIEEAMEAKGVALPLMASHTITDASGRNLSGQTVEAFWNSLRHVKPFSIGINCAFGADRMRPYIADLSRVADTLICAYPNAGLPNAFGDYDELPEETARQLREWAESGLLNIVGGCCGTTPEHIAAIAKAVADQPPRDLPETPVMLRLSGLEPLNLPS